MKVNLKKKLTLEVLEEIYSAGISGGDQDGKFAISRVGNDELAEPIIIPHELHHLMEARFRINCSITIILNKL